MKDIILASGDKEGELDIGKEFFEKEEYAKYKNMGYRKDVYNYSIKPVINDKTRFEHIVNYGVDLDKIVWMSRKEFMEKFFDKLELIIKI